MNFLLTIFALVGTANSLLFEAEFPQAVTNSRNHSNIGDFKALKIIPNQHDQINIKKR